MMRKRAQIHLPALLKTCITCGELRLYSEFNRDRTKRDGLNPRCRSCSRRWHHDNKAHAKAYQGRYYSATREYHSVKAKRYRAVNGDRLNENKRAWDLLNTDRRQEYRISHAMLYRTLQRNRRSRVRGNGGSHTVDDIHSLYREQSGRCRYCAADLSGGYHVDHWMPIALGGSNGPENLQLLCAPCNLSKNAAHPVEYEGRIGFASRTGEI